MTELTLEALQQTISNLSSSDDLSRYLHDSSGVAASGMPARVFRPRTSTEVADIMRACARAGRTITVQGGRTGLAGGAVPDSGDLVLSFELMNQIEHIDTTGGTVTLQAGVVLETLCDAVQAQGWYFPMDCGARASCQIGGNIATNVGGNRVLRYGTIRELVLGLEVVLPDGTLLGMMNHGLKNNTGLDLKHLFIGSEGTLGVITRAVLRLFPHPVQRDSALVALGDIAELAPLLRDARARLPTLSSFEVMWRNYLQAAARVTQLPEPFDGAHPLCVLLEVESGQNDGSAQQALHEFLEERVLAGSALDAILPQSHTQASQLWQLRDAIGEILPGMAPYVAFDIGIPLAQLPGFIERTGNKLDARWPQAQRLLFGHLGDGNLHLSTGPHPAHELAAVESAVYEEVERIGGSISAEHGIGRVKKPFLHHSRSGPELTLMRQIKNLFDPKDGLNRGRVLDTQNT